MTRVGSSQFVWEDGTSAEMERGTARFSSSAFVQGEFVDNVPRLPVRIINHLFPMNWRTVRADRLWGTLILHRAKTISVTHYPVTSETLSYFNWNKRNFNLNKKVVYLLNKYWTK